MAADAMYRAVTPTGLEVSIALSKTRQSLMDVRPQSVPSFGVYHRPLTSHVSRTMLPRPPPMRPIDIRWMEYG
eukprot:scaffold245448_cov19-Prasinocladus_malaysianus.AAC.1